MRSATRRSIPQRARLAGVTWHGYALSRRRRAAKAEQKLANGDDRGAIAQLRDSARRVGKDTPSGVAMFALADAIRG
jgi:hypothetical protein